MFTQADRPLILAYKSAFSSFKKPFSFFKDSIKTNFSSARLFCFKNSLAPSSVYFLSFLTPEAGGMILTWKCDLVGGRRGGPMLDFAGNRIQFDLYDLCNVVALFRGDFIVV